MEIATCTSVDPRASRDRYAEHVNIGSRQNDAPFAFQLAREELGLKRSYYGELTRKNLLENPKFVNAFEGAKARIRTYLFRFVEEPDPLCQTLLECYVAITLNTPHNSFGTTLIIVT